MERVRIFVAQAEYNQPLEDGLKRKMKLRVVMASVMHAAAHEHQGRPLLPFKIRETEKWEHVTLGLPSLLTSRTTIFPLQLLFFSSRVAFLRNNGA